MPRSRVNRVGVVRAYGVVRHHAHQLTLVDFPLDKKRRQSRNASPVQCRLLEQLPVVGDHFHLDSGGDRFAIRRDELPGGTGHEDILQDMVLSEVLPTRASTSVYGANF